MVFLSSKSCFCTDIDSLSFHKFKFYSNSWLYPELVGTGFEPDEPDLSVVALERLFWPAWSIIKRAAQESHSRKWRFHLVICSAEAEPFRRASKAFSDRHVFIIPFLSRFIVFSAGIKCLYIHRRQKYESVTIILEKSGKNHINGNISEVYPANSLQDCLYLTTAILSCIIPALKMIIIFII